MFTKTKLAFVGALVLGLGTVAQAGSKDDADHTGGHRVGPLSQSFPGANPVSHPSMRGRIYARKTYGLSKRPVHHRPGDEEANIRAQDRMYRYSNGIRHSNGDITE